MKLQFEENEYYLMKYGAELAIATTDESFIKELGAERLSRKNCEAIANGYDLVELFDEVDESIDYQEFDFSSFKLGFKKAIELLGDKKFSVDDVLNLIKRSREKTPYNFDGKSTEYKFSEDELIHSLQQNEWDVVIEMEKCGYCEGCNKAGMLHCAHADSCGFPIETERPKLDADGCLILKRK